jgi:hypothetical protein
LPPGASFDPELLLLLFTLLQGMRKILSPPVLAVLRIPFSLDAS